MASNGGSAEDGSCCAECGRLKGRMESLLEHLRQELESPISSILGVAGLLQNSGLSGEQAEYLRVIRDAAEGMDLVRRSMGDMDWQDARSALAGRPISTCACWCTTWSSSPAFTPAAAPAPTRRRPWARRSCRSCGA